MSRLANRRVSSEMDYEWSDLDLPNRLLVHISKRDRANMVHTPQTRIVSRLHGRRPHP
jgi:hypothetical protein